MDNHQGLIIGSGIVIILTGAIVAIQDTKSPWRIVGGGLAFIILLGLLASAGEGPAKIAGGLAAVTAGTIVMYEAIPLFTFVSDLGKGQA